MSTLSSYYLGMAIIAVVIFGITLAYQTMRCDSDAKKDKDAGK